MPIFPSFFVNKTGGYEIEQSLRFNSADSAYLNRTPGSAGNRKTWTWSGWAKRGKLNVLMSFLGVNASGCGDLVTRLQFNSSNQLVFDDFVACGSTHINLITTQVFRDPSAWIHIVVAVDTTQGTAANRAKLYVNGSQVTAFATETYPTQNQDTAWNSTLEQRIGRDGDPNYLDGYLAEVNFIDGSALDHEDFGEFDDNGVWRPIKYAGSYTGNSFYLKFASGDGTDSSGLSNTWTANNFTTSGTGTDVMSDTPTTNWATLNPLRPSSYGSVSLSNGNLNASRNTTSYGSGTATIGVSSGKWYWEVYCNSVGFVTSIGITKDPTANGPGGGQEVYTYHYDGKKYVAGVLQNYSGNSYTNGDLLGFALDLDAGTLVAYKNGTSQGTLQTGLSGTFYPYVTLYGTRNVTFNFGQRAFEQTVPTGYSALNTSNLPAPDIADGSEYFNTVLWTGNGVSGRAITGVGFQPDFLWIKFRNGTASSYLQNSIAGATYYMFSDDTVQERNLDDSVDSFDTDGFTVGNDGGTNGTGGSYVGWSWLAGNGTSSNTDGSITSTVSANPTAGFSIVSYTGNVTSGATIGHGLGVAPSWVIVKNRDSGTQPWRVYHSSLGATKALRLDIDTIQETDTAYWNDTAPSSTVITLGNDNSTNANEDDYIAYCFAEVEGYSKISEFTGNGSTDGSFVYCGFKPSWILLRRYAASRNWYLYDAARDTFNVADHLYYPDLSNVEASTDALDILSNGFKMRTTNTSLNGSGDKILFVAFASNPFGGSGVSPATAR